MTLIRKFQEKEGILIFDEALDEELSSYDSHHLEALARAETSHFWLTTRREKICKIFSKNVKKGSRILEVGGGTGFIAAELIKQGFDVEVSDGASNGLAYAKKLGIKKLYQFDLFQPPFQETFDVICLFDVLEHLNDDVKAMDKLKKMLKPRGQIILTVPAHQWLWSRDDALAGHKRRYTKAQLKEVFRTCGLQPIFLRYFFIMILPLLCLRSFIKKEGSKPIQKNECVNFHIPSSLNWALRLLTKLEFSIDWLLPNIVGGSLIGIARKE